MSGSAAIEETKSLRCFHEPPTISVTLLGLSGLEPPTSRLSGVRSNHLSYKPIWIWPFLPAHHLIVDNLHCLPGECEIRTRDLLLARQALSQLR